MYITLSEAKDHLRVDRGWRGEDPYILSLIEAAESAVEKLADRPLSDCLVRGALETTLKQAALLLVGHWFANREAAAFAQASEPPYAVRTLVALNKNLSI